MKQIFSYDATAHIFYILVSILVGIYSEVIIRWYSSSIFNFLRKLRTIFLVAIPVYMITNDVEGSRFSTSSPNACYLFSGSCEATSHCGFDLLFPKK